MAVFTLYLPAGHQELASLTGIQCGRFNSRYYWQNDRVGRFLFLLPTDIYPLSKILLLANPQYSPVRLIPQTQICGHTNHLELAQNAALKLLTWATIMMIMTIIRLTSCVVLSKHASAYITSSFNPRYEPNYSRDSRPSLLFWPLHSCQCIICLFVTQQWLFILFICCCL